MNKCDTGFPKLADPDITSLFYIFFFNFRTILHFFFLTMTKQDTHPLAISRSSTSEVFVPRLAIKSVEHGAVPAIATMAALAAATLTGRVGWGKGVWGWGCATAGCAGWGCETNQKQTFKWSVFQLSCHCQPLFCCCLLQDHMLLIKKINK